MAHFLLKKFMYIKDMIRDGSSKEKVIHEMISSSCVMDTEIAKKLYYVLCADIKDERK